MGAAGQALRVRRVTSMLVGNSGAAQLEASLAVMRNPGVPSREDRPPTAVLQPLATRLRRASDERHRRLLSDVAPGQRVRYVRRRSQRQERR